MGVHGEEKPSSANLFFPFALLISNVSISSSCGDFGTPCFSRCLPAARIRASRWHRATSGSKTHHGESSLITISSSNRIYWAQDNCMSSSIERRYDKTRLQLRFYARQFIDAMSPSNFPATNPEVIRKAIETRSASLSDGMKNLIDDLDKGRITRVDESAFEGGAISRPQLAR
jgi:hypothetical protein